MQFDRKITISAGSSRRAMVWQAQTLLISELWAKLQTPARGTEPLAEYLNMKKAQQDDLKDVGGFMAGTLSGPRRKANNVTGRDVITLDLDNIPPGGTEDVLRRVEGLSCGYCIYSTRKHSPAAPRLRVLLPLDRTASADEYEPIARKMAEYIGLELCDPTTFEVSRLMYWPSCCSDSQYIYVWKDKPLLSVKGLLGHLITDAKHELELFQHDLNISDLLSDVGGVVLATEVFGELLGELRHLLHADRALAGLAIDIHRKLADCRFAFGHLKNLPVLRSRSSMRATSSKPLSAMINLRTLMRVLTLASSASCPSADTFLMALYAVGSV